MTIHFSAVFLQTRATANRQLALIHIVFACDLPQKSITQIALPSFLYSLVLVALPAFAALVRRRWLLSARGVAAAGWIAASPLLLVACAGEWLLALLRLRLLVASCACCAVGRLVVASSVVLLPAVRVATGAHGARLTQLAVRCWVLRAGAETSSGRLTTCYPLGLVAAALQLRGESFASWGSLLLVLVAAGVEVSVAVALGHGLGLRIVADVDCRCHCSLFDGCLSAILRHRSTHDTHLLRLGWA